MEKNDHKRRTRLTEIDEKGEIGECVGMGAMKDACHGPQMDINIMCVCCTISFSRVSNE